MPSNPNISVMVTGYVSPAVRRRMRGVQKRKPGWTISKQVARCLALSLAVLESEAGIKKFSSDTTRVLPS